MRLKNIQKSGAKMQLTQVMGSMGVLNVKLGYCYKALGNFQQVARIFGEIGNESMVAQSYNLIGSVYLRMGEHDQTASIMDKALTIFRKNNNSWYVSKALFKF